MTLRKTLQKIIVKESVVYGIKVRVQDKNYQIYVLMTYSF